jgi:hypothetical protein
MTLNDYQTLAQRTSGNALPSNKIENGILDYPENPASVPTCTRSTSIRVMSLTVKP